MGSTLLTQMNVYQTNYPVALEMGNLTQLVKCRGCSADPPENCHLTVKKLPKT